MSNGSTLSESIPDAPVSAAIPLKGLRGAIARTLTAAWQAPRVAMTAEVDMEACLNQLKAFNAFRTADPIRVSHVVVHVLSKALREHPRLNASLQNNAITELPDIHVAFAVSVTDGLVAPVIRNADLMSIEEIARTMTTLAEKARAGALPPRALQGGTFTVSNLGLSNIDWFTPILNAPQVAILGMARTKPRPIVRGGELAISEQMPLTLVFDHRAIDGLPAARFLDEVRRRIEGWSV